MFKFNFDIDENSKRECSNEKQDDVNVSNQEFGCFYLNDLRNEDAENGRNKFDFYTSDLVPNVYEGGVRQFEEFINKTGLFNTRVVRVIDANVKREILEIKRSNC
ncbi:unnamed protein product [Rotaria magnacalcarata]|uniref:Uncharacterized protein n=1 Tax=Rotaria magnacalcarata TaxID=392030 RepID=A0A8S2QAS6_9BILA|nr:unnamed protein product [Rotaria magnacalcarata]